MGVGESQPRWDFFVSYTQADRAWAEWIAWVLEEEGHQVLIQAWDFVPGSNWIQGMQAGVTRASRTIAVLSPAYLESEYGTAEWAAAWGSDPAGRQRKLLIIRVKECDRPGLLSGVVSVDLFRTTEAEAQTRLRAMVSSVMLGRAKPDLPPKFPGSRAMPREPRFPSALPMVWKVPARNPNFTGRGEELVSLAMALASGSTATVQSLRGMGGIGKTQLATEYCHAHAGDYDLVYWITAEESATIPDQFAALAAQLGLDPVPDPETLQGQIHNRLRSVPGWLLIFDNADEAENIRAWLPSAPLPPGIPGHVIVTTRRGGFAALGHVMELDVIDLPAAVMLLKKRVPDLDDAVAQDISRELGQLPLALEQAAAYMDRSAMPARDYLDLLRQRAADLYTRGQVTGHDHTIATLWDITLERISTENPAAVVLVGLCAYLAPEPIPLDLFSLHADLLPEPLSQTAVDQLAFNEVIGTLVDYSLAKRTPSGLQVHRLVQSVIRARHVFASNGFPTRHLMIGDESAAHGSLGLGVILRLLRAVAPRQLMEAPQTWPRWAALLPHLLAAVGHFDSLPWQAQQAFGADASWLLDRAAAYLDVHARPGEARPLATKALAITEASQGPDHPDVGTFLNNLAGIFRNLGQPAEARPLLERALAITEAAHGPHHPNVAANLGNLATTLQELGEPAEARPLAERALAIDQAIYGPDHPVIAIRLNNLAFILSGVGQLAVARPLAERALAIDQAVYGPDDPRVATRLGNLALILQELGKPAEARPLAERALVIDQAAYGPDHPAVATIVSNLALILQDLGENAGARPLAERALAIHQATYGPDHPAVATDLSNLVGILHALGQDAEARPLAERALAIDQATYGPDHPAVATIVSNLAFILQKLGENAEARPLAERALAIHQATYGPDHPAVATDLSNLAGILHALGQDAEARPLAERALAIDQAAYGPDHPAVATDLSNLAGILHALNQATEARPMAEQRPGCYEGSDVAQQNAPPHGETDGGT
jgi:tetratricopeptide (TPR) repeat protein